MIYSALSIGLPEIRPYWKGTSTKFGWLSSLGLVVFFWGIPLLMLASRHKLVPDTFAYVLWGCLFALISTLGYLMDVGE